MCDRERLHAVALPTNKQPDPSQEWAVSTKLSTVLTAHKSHLQNGETKKPPSTLFQTHIKTVSVTRLCRGKHHLQHRVPLLQPLITVTVKPLLSCFSVITLPSHGNLCEIGLDSKVLMSACVWQRRGDSIQILQRGKTRRGHGTSDFMNLWKCVRTSFTFEIICCPFVHKHVGSLNHLCCEARHGPAWDSHCMTTRSRNTILPFSHGVSIKMFTHRKKRVTRSELAVQIFFKT